MFEWIEEILEEQKKYHNMSKEGFIVRIINLYGQAGMFEHAQKVFDEMPERNCKRTVLSFNFAESGFGGNGSLTKVVALIDETESSQADEINIFGQLGLVV
ncbi:unnamed protein product [Microthlaspi erraticum]|uniref:Pentatricopeptide repeat-containing protein n=1 Tax=Microthlaspi erraticum TaxID=1685480 RepID=A0A6D2JF24_9BRAS|nr:unnamed protein product [Microthlaspi erraticum]